MGIMPYKTQGILSSNLPLNKKFEKHKKIKLKIMLSKLIAKE